MPGKRIWISYHAIAVRKSGLNGEEPRARVALRSIASRACDVKQILAVFRNALDKTGPGLISDLLQQTTGIRSVPNVKISDDTNFRGPGRPSAEGGAPS